MTASPSNAVAAALPAALAAGTREAFEELLTDDVHWGGEPGGNECRTRVVRLTLRSGKISDVRELDPPPTVELLFFDGCPSYDALLPHLRQLLAQHYPTASISLIRIEGLVAGVALLLVLYPHAQSGDDAVVVPHQASSDRRERTHS